MHVRTYNVRKYLEKKRGGGNWQRKVNARKCTRKISFLRTFLFFTYVNVRGQKRDSGNPPLHIEI